VLPWVILNVLYVIYSTVYLLGFPFVTAYQLITPWREDQTESFLLWWSSAIDQGVIQEYPESIPERFLIPRAKEMLIARQNSEDAAAPTWLIDNSDDQHEE